MNGLMPIMSGVQDGCAPKSLDTMISMIVDKGFSISKMYRGSCAVASVLQCIVAKDFSTHPPCVFMDLQQYL